MLHEGFHVLQSQVAPDKLAAAEAINAREGDYWRADAARPDSWKQEVALLVKALNATTEEEARSLARQFIDQRQARRAGSESPR